jgi:NAD-dependent DNA ligase
VPFTLTTAELHDIDSWDDVVRTAPHHTYVTRHMVGTLTRVDTVEADHVCPYCASPTDSEMDERTYYCSERCPASCDADNFQTIIEITSAFRIDIEGARKYMIIVSSFVIRSASKLLCLTCSTAR